jgi:hypothetical protein
LVNLLEPEFAAKLYQWCYPQPEGQTPSPVVVNGRYPLGHIREGLVNAIIHCQPPRDSSSEDCCVEIFASTNALRIQNRCLPIAQRYMASDAMKFHNI